MMLKRNLLCFVTLLMLSFCSLTTEAQSRRPIDSRHPIWLVHIDVWNAADPQKIIDLIPKDIRPFVCMNLSMSCQYDTEKNVYKMPQNAIKTYKSWGSVCQANGLWFTCQPASGGHTHIQDNDLTTFEYFFKRFPNFLGWNYAEQFWGFDEPGDKSSSSQASRLALFAKLIEMSHKYGGFLTVSFCGTIYAHALSPVGMLKRNNDLLEASLKYPEAIVWLYKYTTSGCFYNTESQTLAPFISGLAKNYGVRYDNCGWNGALNNLLGNNHGVKYPVAAGISTVMEQNGVNGGAIWDAPETIPTECFTSDNNTTVNGYTRRNWKYYSGFYNIWMDLFQKIIDGSLYIPTRQEVINHTNIVVVNDVETGNDEQKYATWSDLYDGLYKQDDPMNQGDGYWMNNGSFFKKTGRYRTIPLVTGLYDDLAKSIPLKVYKTDYQSQWPTIAKKVECYNQYYPEMSKGDLFVSRICNQLITYMPYSNLNSKNTATGIIPLQYNTCDSLILSYATLGSGIVREYADHINIYLNNYRSDTLTNRRDQITVMGASSQPSYTAEKRKDATMDVKSEWNAEIGAFTLVVEHNGPVDISIQCAGVATDRKTDKADDSPLTNDYPLQPAAYFGDIYIEAEDMDYKNIKGCVTNPYYSYPDERGHSGNGFMDMGNSTSGSLRHTLNMPQAGDYRISIRYTSPDKGGSLTTYLNGKKNVLNCTKTNTNEWNKVSFNATVKEGDNTMVINNTSGINMYIDLLTYIPAGTPEERYKVTINEAKLGYVTVDTDSAAEKETVTLNIHPNDGCKLTGWEIVHGDIDIADNNSFVMTDDNVSITPIFTDTTETYCMNFLTTESGGFPTGWKATQENSEIHEYPNTYGMGARTFSGFTGYQTKALYWRNGTTEYGCQTNYPLTLAPGDYQLTFAMAAWKGTPTYQVDIRSQKGTIIATSSNYTATPNANGNTLTDLSTAQTGTLDFTVKENDNYIIRFTNTANTGGYQEFLLLECKVNKKVDTSGINEILHFSEGNHITAIYNVSGVKQERLLPGINIVYHADGHCSKILIKQ